MRKQKCYFRQHLAFIILKYPLNFYRTCCIFTGRGGACSSHVKRDAGSCFAFALRTGVLQRVLQNAKIIPTMYLKNLEVSCIIKQSERLLKQVYSKTFYIGMILLWISKKTATV